MENHRHLRNYLIDPALQLRYALLLVGVASALTLSLGWGVFHYMRLAARVVEVRALDPADTLAPVLIEEFRKNDEQMLLFFSVFGGVLMTVLFSSALVFTHRIAGPLHKIAAYMVQVRQGRLATIHDLRRGDQLKEFFGIFREMHGALRGQAERDAVFLEQAEQLLRDGRSAEAGALLAGMRREKRELLL